MRGGKCTAYTRYSIRYIDNRKNNTRYRDYVDIDMYVVDTMHKILWSRKVDTRFCGLLFDDGGMVVRYG